MVRVIFLVFILFSNFRIGSAQNNDFVKGKIDSLGKKTGFHIQFLDARFLVCDSASAFYKHYVYYTDGEPLKHYSLLPKFIKKFELSDALLRDENDSIILLSGKYSFSHRKKQDSLDYVYKGGFLVYERFVKALNKPTIYIPSFKVTPNYEYYTEERFYDMEYGEHFPSYYFESYTLTNNNLKKDYKKFSIYWENSKWKEIAKKESE
jgi:hypothetical protein